MAHISEQRRITYKDLASIADVSVATVARVANGNPRVNAKLRKQVLSAAQELQVDLTPRPRKGMSKAIAFLLGNRKMLHPLHSHFLVGTEEASVSLSYSVIFHCLHYSASISPHEIFLPPILENPRQVSGFILAGTNFPNLLELLSHRRIPFVVVGNNVVGEWDPTPYDVVWFNDIQGAYEITLSLQALGHHAIWYVGNCRFPWYARRYEGYRRAMVKAQLEPRLCEFDSSDDAQLGYLSAKSIIDQNEPVSAIFAGDDQAAQGVCRALKESGLSVPDDVSVAGFDDTESVRWDPPLTTAKVFAEQVSRRMVGLLQRRINHPDAPPQHSVIPTQVIKRESCARISSQVAQGRASAEAVI